MNFFFHERNISQLSTCVFMSACDYRHNVEGPFIDRKSIMKSLCKKAGVQYFRFHPLRHFGASYLESQGHSIKTIQTLLGHENRLTTEIYIHSLSNIDREAMDCLDNALNEVVNVLNFKKAQDQAQDQLKKVFN